MKTTADTPDNFPDFAFRLGFVIAAVGKKEWSGRGEIRAYLMKYGVSEQELDAFYEAGCKLSEAFYREPK